MENNDLQKKMKKKLLILHKRKIIRALMELIKQEEDVYKKISNKKILAVLVERHHWVIPGGKRKRIGPKTK